MSGARRYTREDMAEAWSEGYLARKSEGWQSPGADNPYRATPPFEPDICHEFIDAGKCRHTDSEHDAMADATLRVTSPGVDQ